MGAFLTELRSAVALFLRFAGIDYDGDQAAGEKLDEFVRRIQAVVARNGGTLLDLVIGDKGSYIYAVFGAPVAHENDLPRALNAALELRALQASLPFITGVQIGLSRGAMRTGAYGGATRRTYGVLGDEVNLAARLMQAAAPGQIIVSGQAQSAAGRDFVFEALPPLPVKGRAQPAAAFLLHKTAQHKNYRLLDPSYALPMVGRQAELALIAEKMALAAQGKGQVVGITAEAGMGKSRLVAEAIHLAQRRGFTGYGGACQSDGVNAAYLVWRAILRGFFDLDEEAPPEQQARWLGAALESFAPQRQPTLPLLAGAIGLPLPDNEFTRSLEPKERKSVLEAALVDCLSGAAEAARLGKSALLFVLEDLHWLDALSQDLLNAIALAIEDLPVLILLAYRRTEMAHPAALRVEKLAYFSRIELAGLSLVEAAAAISAKLAQLFPERDARAERDAHPERGGDLPEAMARYLMEKTQGNPFYIEELLNYLHDKGIDPRDDGALEKVELPDSLHTLVLSRLDQLGEYEKTTLKVASIVGRLFHARWLNGYYPELGDDEKLRGCLRQLHELDITPLNTPEPELTYLFKHVVTQEVTYQSIPQSLRASLHEKLASWLEVTLAEPLPLDLLVFHYDRSEHRQKKCEYLLKAGQAASEVSDFNTAAKYFARLVELTPLEDPKYSALAQQLGEAYFRLGDLSAARGALERAQAAAQTDTDRATALALLGNMLVNVGDYVEAQIILAEAVPLARAHQLVRSDQLALCQALYALGGVHLALGALEQARAALNENLALARGLGDVTRELFALNRLGVLASQQDIDEAERLFMEVYQQAVAVGNRERAMGALNNLGTMAADKRQDYATAHRYHEQALALAGELGAQHAIVAFLSNLAHDEIMLGQLATARQKLHDGLSMSLRLGISRWTVLAVMYYADLAYADGKIERALAIYGLAQKHASWTSQNQRDMEDMFAHWALDPALVEAGLAKGAALDWDQTLQELLDEIPPSLN